MAHFLCQFDWAKWYSGSWWKITCGCHWECFQKKLAFEWVDWGKKVTLTSVDGQQHPIHWWPDQNRRLEEEWITLSLARTSTSSELHPSRTELHQHSFWISTLQTARSWDFLSSIIMGANSYNKAPHLQREKGLGRGRGWGRDWNWDSGSLKTLMNRGEKPEFSQKLADKFWVCPESYRSRLELMRGGAVSSLSVRRKQRARTMGLKTKPRSSLELIMKSYASFHLGALTYSGLSRRLNFRLDLY